MIAVWSALIAIALLVLLLLVGVKGTLTARELEEAPGASLEDLTATEVCPAELADRIFGRADWEFVSNLKYPGVASLFRRERKALALLWIEQVAVSIRQIMREHASVARRTRDLELVTEARLLAQYAGSMLLCGALFLLIHVTGPVWLGGLASYAQTLSERIADTQRAFRLTVDVPERATVPQ